jgi:hypothetical protein
MHDEMIDKIKQTLFKRYTSEEKKGLFITWFWKNKNVLVSQGVVVTDKPIRELVEILYNTHVAPIINEVFFVSIDVVTDLIEVAEPVEVLTKSPEEWWFIVSAVQSDKSGVILPAMEWLTDAKSALFYIKKKYGIDGNVDVAIFRTQRILLGK